MPAASTHWLATGSAQSVLERGGTAVDAAVAIEHAAALGLDQMPDWSLGRLSTVTRDPATGALAAAANPRGAQGYAAGR